MPSIKTPWNCNMKLIVKGKAVNLISDEAIRAFAQEIEA